MPLDEYARKRRFDKTPEPAAESARAEARPPSNAREPAPAGAGSFVVQKHDASRLHYDFRLELHGVLLSWAIPKGPSLDPRNKKLAVHVEDHPIEYASFEGVIPEGEYGAGTVIVWDRGWWEPQPADAYKGGARAAAEPAARLAKGDLKFRLHGEKLEGGWTLVRLKPRENERAENWLLIKERDEFARPSAEFEILAERPASVLSGRTIEQVAAGEPTAATETRAARADASAPPLPPGSDPPPVDAPLHLATLVDEAPDGEGWIHEVKYDGYRIKAVLESGRARLLTRNGLDWTTAFAPIAHALERLPVGSAVLDGEVVAFDSAGVSDFGTLQDAIANKRTERLVYVVFDLLHLEGHDLRSAPLLERKELLRALLETQPPRGAQPPGGTLASPIRYADHYADQGSEFQREACELGLEGSVSKRADRPYVGGRTRDWLKVKCTEEQEFVVGGFTEPGGSRKGFGALLLGVYTAEGDLRYTGRVGTGFDERTLADLRKRLDDLEIDDPPFANPPRLGAKAHWVRPELVAEVAFAEWTRDGLIRQPSFRGLREDKAPTEVTFEVTEAATGVARPPAAGSVRTTAVGPPHPRGAREFGPDTSVAGVRVTNPEKLLFEDSALTKLDLVRYYEAVAQHMLPHVERRPLTLVRCPIGRGKGCFYQKHPDDGMPRSLKTITIEEKDGPALYLWIDDVASLLSLAQLGVLEIHTWGSCVDQPYMPDRLVFDLDPGPGVTWPRVVETALLVRERLEPLGFTPFVKTTGGRGLHVVVPVEPSLAYNEARAWTKSFVESLVAEDPSSLTSQMAKKLRSGRVFIDYVRNSQGATAVAPYSTRARLGAPIAVPVEWDELRGDLDPKRFTAEAVLRRLRELGHDPWADMDAARAGEHVLRKVALAAS